MQPALSPNDLLPPHAEMVRGTCAGIIRAALGDIAQQTSMIRYRGEINRRLAMGDTLTEAEAADSALFSEIDCWEADCIAVREAAVAAQTPISDIIWPPPPAGLTADWLKGF
jgi:hypothetical protein